MKTFKRFSVTFFILALMNLIPKMLQSIKIMNDYDGSMGLTLRILKLSYLVFFLVMFSSDNIWLNYRLFNYLLIPLALIPIKFVEVVILSRKLILPIKVSFENPAQTFSMSRSYVFIMAALFASSLAFSTWMFPEPTKYWFWGILPLLLSILMFILISARLANHQPNFYEYFILITSTAAALNALLNIFLFIRNKSGLVEVLNTRFAPSFGSLPDHFISNAALTYTIFFGLSVSGLFVLKLKSYQKILVANALVLSAAILLTQSRAPILGIAFSTIFILFYKSWRRHTLYLVFWPFIFVFSYQIVCFAEIYHLRIFSFRDEVWRIYFPIIIDRFMFGYGQRIEFSLPISNGELVAQPLNMILTAIMRGGILAGLSIISMFILAINYCLKFYRNSNNFVPLLLIIILAIAGLFDFPLAIYIPDWKWVDFWMPIGLCIAAERKKKKVNEF